MDVRTAGATKKSCVACRRSHAVLGRDLCERCSAVEERGPRRRRAVSAERTAMSSRRVAYASGRAAVWYSQPAFDSD